MKILKFAVWAIMTGVLFFSSCSNEEFTEKQQNMVTAPSFSGTIGELVDVNLAPKTKSGVIEDNENYADGEKFYWHNGDKAKVLFFPDGDINSTPVELIYTAVVAEGQKNNSCEFTTTGSLPVGNYTAYALYPADGWSKDSNRYKATSSNFIIQNDASSTHLKDHMFMKACADNITIVGEGSNSIDLKFEHLSSVVRFHITSDYNANSLTMNSLIFREKSGRDFFYTAAHLGSVDGTFLSPAALSWNSELTAISMTDLSFTKKGSTWEIDLYLPVFPTTVDAYFGGMAMQIETYITINGSDIRLQYFGTYDGLSFTNELSFMPNGFEAGKSYFFNLKVDSSGFPPISETSYSVGDYWPNATNPEGVVFWVEPGSSGTHGKVVGLEETYVPKWGTDNDEEVAGVTGIRSLTDGTTATKSMIAKYKDSPTFSTDYPAFHYIYNTVNSGDQNGVWHLPACDELKMLFAGYSGKVYESIVNWTTGDMPDYNSADCIAARAVFNAKLTAKGGMAIAGSGNTVSEWYWSSTEVFPNTSYSLNFTNGMYSEDGKGYDGNIRWIREF